MNRAELNIIVEWCLAKWIVTFYIMFIGFFAAGVAGSNPYFLFVGDGCVVVAQLIELFMGDD